MSAVSNFNYKSDLGEGLRALAAGRLKRAEDCFRRLVKNFPTADGGYRELASALQMPERTIRREPDTSPVEMTTTPPPEDSVAAAPEEAVEAEQASLADRLSWLGTPETAVPAPPTAAASQASALLSSAME